MKQNNKKHGAKYNFAPFTRKISIKFNRKYKNYTEPQRRLKSYKTVCSVCKRDINNISESFLDNNGNYMHFDCVFESVKKEFNQSINQKIIYSGNGRFSLIKKTSDEKYIIESTFTFEDKETNKIIKENIEKLMI